MCNDYRMLVDLASITEDFDNLSIKIGMGSIGGECGAGELVNRRWSWPRPKGKPVYNFRSEGRKFDSHRCLILADGSYEFTDPVDPGQNRLDEWLLRWPTNLVLHCGDIAGEPKGEAFTMLTMDAGLDVAPYHHRQNIPLARDQWADWLGSAVPAADVLKGLSKGSLSVTEVYGTPPAQGALIL